MKSTKKLIPALAMLIVSAVVMSTASYAWFSMNKEVAAEDMQITVKSDNTYLLIGTGTNNTAALIQEANPNTTISITVDDTAAKVYPAAPVISDPEIAYTAIGRKDIDNVDVATPGAAITDDDTAAVATNWYTANAIAPDAAAIDAGTAKQLTAAKFGQYVIKKTVYLTVADGANDANDLSVTATIAAKAGGTDYDAVKILVVTDDGAMATLDKDTLTADISGTNTNITDSTVRTVDIYIYYDGNDATVFTNNATDLTGADINFTFNVEAVPQA